MREEERQKQAREEERLSKVSQKQILNRKGKERAKLSFWIKPS